MNAKRILLAIVASSALITASASAAIIATGSKNHALDGISAAQRTAAAADVIDPTLVSAIQQSEQRFGTADAVGKRLVDEAVALGKTALGDQLYVLPSSTDKLCVLVARAVSCGESLTPASPVTFNVLTTSAGTLIYGVARDDVASVSYTQAGETHVLRVSGNTFSGTGGSGPAGGIVATFSDGHSVTVG